MDVENVGYTPWLRFINRDGQCTHLIVKTSRQDLLVIEVTPFEHNEGIKTSILTSSITPHEFVLSCTKHQSDIKLHICFLSHNGLDLYHILGYSLLYKESKLESPKFKMGEKFIIPVPYVKENDLRSHLNKGEKFRYFIEADSRMSIFYNLLKRSNCEHLLDASGPYALFAPNNAMLEHAYGNKARNLKSKSKALDAIVCSYFVVGHHEIDKSNDVISLTGQPLKLIKGLLQIPRHEVTRIEPTIITANGTMTIINSDGVLFPVNSSFFVAPKPILSHVTITDIHKASTKLYDITLNYSKQVRQATRQHIIIMQKKLDELDSLDDNANNFEHVKSASRLIALQNNIETLTKNMKHI